MRRIVPEDAEAHLLGVRAKLASHTATRADHRLALDAILCLPEPDAGDWLIEITEGFAVVYSHERARAAFAAASARVRDPSP